MKYLKPTQKELVIALTIVIMALLGVIFFQTCNHPKPVVHTVTRIDTFKLVDKDTIYTEPRIITRIKQPLPPELVPDNDCERLKIQFQNLAIDYNNLNIYQDTIRSGESFVAITDSIRSNKHQGRKTYFEITNKQIKESTKTTFTNPPRRQVYIGGGVSSNSVLDRAHINAGILYKNKQDNMFGINTGIDNKGNILYGVSYYAKISLRRKP